MQRSVFNIIAVLLLLASMTYAYSGGSGKSDDPYQIATAQDLIDLGLRAEDYDKCFILTADIDLDPNLPGRKVFDRAVIAPDVNSVVGDYQGIPFTGIFDGNSHSISHLTIKGHSYLGLFGQLRAKATVFDLDLCTVDIEGAGEFIGALAGSTRGSGIHDARPRGDIRNCHSTGIVHGWIYVGGLVGANRAAIDTCSSHGSVNGGSFIGGLIGWNNGEITGSYSGVSTWGRHTVGGIVGSNGGGNGQYGTYSRINACYSTGTITVNSNHHSYFIGGLVGRNHYTCSIVNSYSTSKITGTGEYGGLVGENGGSIIQSYSTGTAGNGMLVGGLVAYNAEKASIESSYYAGEVRGRIWPVGGLAGINAGSISMSYSTGMVIGEDEAYTGGLAGRNSGHISMSYSASIVKGMTGRTGGLIGHNKGSTLSCFWDVESSGQGTSAGGIGLSTAKMQTPETFLDAGWDFIDETANDTEDIWWIPKIPHYPRLWWQFGYAFAPYPENRARDVQPETILGWHSGGEGLRFDVYLGRESETVFQATPETLGIYRGQISTQQVTFNPGPLEWGTTYYWRIDSISDDDPNLIRKGQLWQFTTQTEFIAVDNFETCMNGVMNNNNIRQTWRDGFGCPDSDPIVPGNGTGSSISCIDDPAFVYNGQAAMAIDYNNVNEPYYSEVERAWAIPQDWSTKEWDLLVLSFKGQEHNTPDWLSVRITDSAGRTSVASSPGRRELMLTEWQTWAISLRELGSWDDRRLPVDLDLSSIRKLVIGVHSPYMRRSQPQPGGQGRVYIDDIRLSKSLPE